MSILFLPIDINLSSTEFTRPSSSITLKEYNPYWTSTPVSVIENDFYDVLKQLPLEKITTLTHKIQQRQVGSHVDVYPSMTFGDGELDNIKDNEPSGYRFVVNGKVDSIEVFDGKEWVTATLPSVPCCYLLNSTIGKHRVKEDVNREIIYVRGFINSKQHQELIARSLKKYKDFAIYAQ